MVFIALAIVLTQIFQKFQLINNLYMQIMVHGVLYLLLYVLFNKLEWGVENSNL